MYKPIFLSILMNFLVPFMGISFSASQTEKGAADSPPFATAQVFSQRGLPLEFIPNAGQTDSLVSFYVKGSDRIVYFTSEGVTVALYKNGEAVKPERDRTLTVPRERRASSRESWVVKMDFIGARKDVVPEGLERTGTVFSYFRGQPGDWHAGFPGFGRLIYRDLWPGVDLVYKGDIGRLKYELIVAPGADPRSIGLGIRGAQGVAVDGEGRLVVDTPLEKIVDERPFVYQDDGTGERRSIEAAYRLEETKPGGTKVGFSLGGYDPSLPVIIDPATLVYCGYIGATLASYWGDWGEGIAVDSAGCAYITGFAEDIDGTFPVIVGPDLSYNGGAFDAFVAKVNSSGTGLVYCGFIGGAGYDQGYAIAVDSQGCAYVTGYAGSTEASFPVLQGPDLTHNSAGDAFVAKVKADGTGLEYCGFIGGNGTDFGCGIAVDSSDSAYIGGFTYSTEATFPVSGGPDLTHNGYNDVFVAKVKTDGTGLEFCGYIGGEYQDYAYGIALDAWGCVYVTGYTTSSEATFPVVVGPDLTYNSTPSAPSDVFVAKVKADGSGLDYCGYIGGSSEDIGIGVAVDGTGCAYVSGYTRSTEATFPVRQGPELIYNGGLYDAFVAKVKADGTALDYCGYIGGTGTDYGYGIAVDGSGCAYVTGTTESDEGSFPVKVGPDLTYYSYGDVFVAMVDASGTELVYCGYIGGWDYEEGYGIAVDGSGCAYIAGSTYSPETWGFPVVVGPDLTHNGSFDAFVAKVAYEPEERFADIALSKSADNLRPYVDDTVSFTVTAADLGPDDATGVVVSDLLPSGLSFVSASASQGGYDEATGLWTVGGLRNGGSAVLTLRAKADMEGTLINTADVAGLNETDPNRINDTASVSLVAEYRVYAPASFALQRLENDLIFSSEYVNRLTWAANPLNRSVIVTYRLYRKSKGQPDSAFALYREFASSVTSYDDRGLRAEELFTYRMTSVNDKGKESDPVEAGN